MLIDTDYQLIGSVPLHVISGLQKLASTLDWTTTEFDRNDPYLNTRIVRVPYNVRIEPSQELTHNVSSVLTEFEPVDQWIHLQYPEHTFIKCEIACLLPGDKLKFHVDSRWWHQHSHRIHVPITSNPDCFWCVEDREHYLKVGEYYEINNRRYHSYCNRGATPRLHLIFDIISNKKYQAALTEGIDIGSKTFETLFLTQEEFFQVLPELCKDNYF